MNEVTIGTIMDDLKATVDATLYAQVDGLINDGFRTVKKLLDEKLSVEAERDAARAAQDLLRGELVAVTAGRDELLLALGAEFVPEALTVIKAQKAEIERLRMALQLIANNAPTDDQLTDYEMIVAGQEMIVAGHLAKQALGQ